jgi:hypothetical protein
MANDLKPKFSDRVLLNKLNLLALSYERIYGYDLEAYRILRAVHTRFNEFVEHEPLDFIATASLAPIKQP